MVIKFDDALKTTSNPNRPFLLNMLYQNLAFIVIGSSILAVNPIELGMPFLEREPNQFEC